MEITEKTVNDDTRAAKKKNLRFTRAGLDISNYIIGELIV